MARKTRDTKATLRKHSVDDKSDDMPAFIRILFPETDDKYEPLVDGLLLQHGIYKDIMEVLEELFEIDSAFLGEHCVLLLGESRLGKTRLLAEFVAAHLPTRTPEGLIMPVVYVEVPEKPTIRSLAAAILSAFGEEPLKGETADELLKRIATLAKNTGVRVICLDDLHHFTDQRGGTVQYELTEWLKRLVIQMRVALVISGLERSEAAIRRNEQLYNRFDAKLQLRRFDWRKDYDRKQFAKIVRGVYLSLEQEFTLPPLDENGLFQWYVACAGRIGFIVKISRRAIKIARKQKTKNITREILLAAWMRSVFNSSDIPTNQRPFSDMFSWKDEKDTINDVLKIGREAAPREDGKKSKSRGSKAARKEAVREAFRKKSS